MTESCNNYNKLWENKGGSLKNEWENCIAGNRIDPNNPNVKQHKEKVNKLCCSEIMQCKNPNTWFLKNNIDAKCKLTQNPNQPHFGDIQLYVKNKMIGIF